MYLLSVFVHPFHRYSGFLDYHAAVWTPNLDSFTTKFAADSVPFRQRRFQDAGNTYYSAMVYVPKSQLVIEVISDMASNPETGWVDTSEIRHYFQGRSPPSVDEGYLCPSFTYPAYQPLLDIS